MLEGYSNNDSEGIFPWSTGGTIPSNKTSGTTIAGTATTDTGIAGTATTATAITGAAMLERATASPDRAVVQQKTNAPHAQHARDSSVKTKHADTLHSSEWTKITLYLSVKLRC